jgi:citrate lyase subunit beta/citryl-CoA lyase
MLIRSLLFAPANRLDFAAKLAVSGADCVVLDLEDSVPAGERAGRARSTSRAA